MQPKCEMVPRMRRAVAAQAQGLEISGAQAHTVDLDKGRDEELVDAG
jgi:hypothetical protein